MSATVKEEAGAKLLYHRGKELTLEAKDEVSGKLLLLHAVDAGIDYEHQREHVIIFKNTAISFQNAAHCTEVWLKMQMFTSITSEQPPSKKSASKGAAPNQKREPKPESAKGV